MRRKIIAGYVSQIYVVLVGIAALPFYIRYMGAEAYGLVGFFSMMQMWFTLLDAGLTPTLARETARFRGGAISAQNYRQLVRAMEGLFWGVAVLGGLVLYVLAGGVASHWLKFEKLSVSEVVFSIKLMAVIVALRWVCSLYRGIVSGSEQQIWLGGFNMLVATVRFVCVVPIFIFVGSGPIIFFKYQLIVALIEIVGVFFSGL